MAEEAAQGMNGSVLITGGSGFLGYGLVAKLLENGCPRICVYSRNEYSQALMRAHFNSDTRLRFFIGDVRDRERLTRAMDRVTSVIHAAALKRIEVGAYCPDEMTRTNVDGTINVVDAARSAGVERVLLVSSDKAFEPVSPYGLSKALAEWMFFAANNVYGPRFAVCRYGNVAGSTGSVIPTWKALIGKGEDVPVTDPDATRFWMTRDEAVVLVLGTLREMVGGELAIPELPAFRVGDLVDALGARFRIVGMGEHEKKHEAMEAGNSSDKARRMTVEEIRSALQKL